MSKQDVKKLEAAISSLWFIRPMTYWIIVPSLFGFILKRSPNSSQRVSHCSKHSFSHRAFCNNQEKASAESINIASSLIKADKLVSADSYHPYFKCFLKALCAASF